MSSTDLSAIWHLIIACIEIVVLMPIYFLILIAICASRKRDTVFQTHYYTLVISQGLADFATICIFGPVSAARTFGFGNTVVYQIGDFGAARFLVAGAPYLLITRGIGVALITVQRFLTLCRHHSWLEKQVKGLCPATIITFHWFLSLLIYSPGILLSEGSYFENEETLFIISSGLFNKVSPLCVVTSFFFCTVITITLYAIIVNFLCSAKKISLVSGKSRTTRSNEYRLCCHVFLLTIVGILIFFYWLAELLYGGESDRQVLHVVRERYPLISGNYTFLNPIVLLVLNRDIQRVLKRVVQRKKVSTISASGIKGISMVGVAS